MNTSNKVAVSPRTSWKRTSSFGVDDPSDANHYPSLPGGPTVPPAASERRLSRLSSSFKQALSSVDPISQAPAEALRQPALTAINEDTAVESPRISAVRPNLTTDAASSISATSAQSAAPTGATAHDFRAGQARHSRSSSQLPSIQIQLDKRSPVPSDIHFDSEVVSLVTESEAAAGPSFQATSGPDIASSSLTAQPGVAVENTIPAVEETAATPALVSREEDDLKALIRQRRHWLQVPEAKPAAATPRSADVGGSKGFFYSVYYTAGALYGSYLGLKQGLWRH